MHKYHMVMGIERPEGHQPGVAPDFNAMRREIVQATRNSSITNAIMRSADMMGLSAEDRYTWLAYEALVALETYWKMASRAAALHPNPAMIFADSRLDP